MIRAPRPDEIPVRLEVRKDAAFRAPPVAHFRPAVLPGVEESPGQNPTPDGGAVHRRILAGAVVVGLGIILACVFMVRSEKSSSQTAVSPPETPVVQPPIPQPPVSKESSAPTAQDVLLDSRVPPEGMDVHAFVRKSADVFGAFLVARSLDERMPLLETTTPREELEKSVLTGILPANGSFESLEVRFNKILGTSEVIFKAGFVDVDGVAESYLILVRTRGDQVPKVVADPFLDTYGGRFAQFLAEPKPGAHRFQMVATIFDFCSDESIPDYQQKSTMKISVARGAPDLAKAYFAKASPLTEKLKKLGVRYGHGTGATITVQWYTTGEPYLEVVDVASLDWSE